ncbi:MAG: hypothetical protein SO005_10560 [Candidatus Choladocola sp.]|nr:hypothetical protein [Candidatus Choladocola sp.]
MEMYTTSQWVMFFYIYCFLGWVWESAYVSVIKHRFVNRGFLKGPFLPLYGSGAICILVVTIPVRGNIPLMFLIGMVSATVLEYVTGVVMERLFRVRYWDYTGKFMNIKGHICLSSTLCWGVMTILVVDGLHKYIENLVFSVDERYITLAVLILTPILTADFVTSFHAAIHLRDTLVRNEKIKEELGKLVEKKRELELRLAEAGEKAKEQAMEQMPQEMQELLLKIGELRGRLKIPSIRSGKSVRGLLRRNPSAISPWHKETFAELKTNLIEKFEEIRKQDE